MTDRLITDLTFNNRTLLAYFIDIIKRKMQHKHRRFKTLLKSSNIKLSNAVVVLRLLCYKIRIQTSLQPI